MGQRNTSFTKQVPHLSGFFSVRLDVKVCEQNLEDGGHNHDDLHEGQTRGASEHQALQGREVEVRCGKDINKYIAEIIHEKKQKQRYLH